MDFRLSARRDVTAVKAFFRKAVSKQPQPPQTVTLDGYAASHRAVRELKAIGLLPQATRLRMSEFLNDLVEQVRRNAKLRIGTMLGFKAFRNAGVTIAGIELMHRIHKGQFSLSRLALNDAHTPAIWSAALAAH